MLNAGKAEFLKVEEAEDKKTWVLPEITLDNLKSGGTINEQDFLDRAEVLCHLNYTVVVSNCTNYSNLIDYLSDYKILKLGILIGVRELLNIINEKFYKNQGGKLLGSFGELFSRSVKLFVYPCLQEGSSELMKSSNLPIPEGISFLYKHLTHNKQIIDIEGFNQDILHIYSKDVLKALRAAEPEWEKNVTPAIANLIKEKCLFGFPCERIEFEY